MYCPSDDYYSEGNSIGCFGRVLWVDFLTVWGYQPIYRIDMAVWGYQPIYRIDMCARILGSTSMSISTHTLFTLGTYGRIRANAIAGTHLKKWNLF